MKLNTYETDSLNFVNLGDPDGESTLNVFICRLKGDLKEKLSKHQEWLKTNQSVIVQKEIDYLLGLYDPDFTVEQGFISVLQSLISASVDYHKNLDDLIKTIHKIPEKSFILAKFTRIQTFILRDVEYMNQEYVLKFLFSYALKTLTIAELFEIIFIILTESAKGELTYSSNFLKLVEVRKTEEWNEYPVDWIANMYL